MTVLSVRCLIIKHDSGEICSVEPGNTLFDRDGSRVTWNVTEGITKVFFGYESEGY